MDSASDFIKHYITYLKKNDKEPKHAKIVYDSYVKQSKGGNCGFNYFRTKYNLALRTNGFDIEKDIYNKPSVKVREEVAYNAPASPVNFQPISHVDYQEEVKVIPFRTIPTNTIYDIYHCETIEQRKEICDVCSTENPMLSDVCSNCNTRIENEQVLPGLVRGAADIIYGDPGAGKTTLACYLGSEASYNNEAVFTSFICGEMTRREWDKELSKFPRFRNIKVFFIEDIKDDPNYLLHLEHIFEVSDIVIADSFPKILYHIMNLELFKQEKVAIKFLVDFFKKMPEKHNCNLQLINQVIKDGSYKGGTELPHELSSLKKKKVNHEYKS